MVWTKMLMKTSLVATLAGGFMFFGNATNVRADDRDSCYQNVQNLERKLDRDVERHGADSRQAKHDRHEMEEARGVNLSTANTQKNKKRAAHHHRGRPVFNSGLSRLHAVLSVSGSY